MIRRIAKLALILFAIANIAATCKGTETGNPGVPSDNPDGGGTSGGGTTTGGETGCPALKVQASPGSDEVVDNLILALCYKIILCGVVTTTDTCFNALNGADGDRMTDEFGLPEGTFTVVQLREALLNGDFAASSSSASTCETSIGSVDCAVVGANISSGDFSRTEEIVPPECAAVFGAVGADGSPVACP